MKPLLRNTVMHVACAVMLIGVADARADVIIDWNGKANEVIAEAKMGTPPSLASEAWARATSWASYLDAPMHPKYPSEHIILAGALATVIKD